MITLLTGAPGAGKSAALVDMLREWSGKGRAIYADGVPELAIEHQAIDARTWPETVPDGSLVVIDEVQRVWRPTGPGQKIAPDIAALETHRHRGIDFLIVTQHPKLVHANVRALVGRHIHLRDIGLLGRWWYEWPECADPGTWKSAPLKRRYKLPKRVFGLYKSASEHVKPVRSFPKVVAVLGAAVVGVGVLAWQVYGAIQSRMSPAPAPVPAAASAPALPGVHRAIHTKAAVHSDAAGIREAFTPRIAERPDTAPAYDHLRVVVVMPRIVGGYCQGERCRCQTQQGTDAGITDADCRAWINSPPFDPYKPPEAAPAQATRSQEAPSQSAPIPGQSTLPPA